jgi:hypothetical protein
MGGIACALWIGGFAQLWRVWVATTRKPDTVPVLRHRENAGSYDRHVITLQRDVLFRGSWVLNYYSCLRFDRPFPTGYGPQFAVQLSNGTGARHPIIRPLTKIKDTSPA